jgi:hypothetical protein
MNYALVGLVIGTLLAAAPTGGAAAPPVAELSPEDRTGVFTAAGFKQKGDQWIRCEEEVPTASYVSGQIEVVDLNGDGRPEVWVTEGSVFCYGNTGQATVLVTKDANGTWRKILDEVGVGLPLEGRHLGWPDIEVGGPGFDKVPPHRWNGSTYERAK